jgi:hypothetical protein
MSTYFTGRINGVSKAHFDFNDYFRISKDTISLLALSLLLFDFVSEVE